VVCKRPVGLADMAFQILFHRIGSLSLGEPQTMGYAEHVRVDRNDRLSVED
jgi:hypothetical protein